VSLRAMEARAAIGDYDKQTKRYFLHAGSGGVVRQKGEIATILRVKPDRVRVVALDIGGNFGTRIRSFPNFLWCCGPRRKRRRSNGHASAAKLFSATIRVAISSQRSTSLSMPWDDSRPCGVIT